mmetsp:Transcript_39623/g.65837  ORF Transcript_39623/g.65837 Transcript_39623/m.65837 type:complete len:481 (-) Transcript_39623:431-1873(-)
MLRQGDVVERRGFGRDDGRALRRDPRGHALRGREGIRGPQRRPRGRALPPSGATGVGRAGTEGRLAADGGRGLALTAHRGRHVTAHRGRGLAAHAAQGHAGRSLEGAFQRGCPGKSAAGALRGGRPNRGSALRRGRPHAPAAPGACRAAGGQGAGCGDGAAAVAARGVAWALGRRLVKIRAFEWALAHEARALRWRAEVGHCAQNGRLGLGLGQDIQQHVPSVNEGLAVLLRPLRRKPPQLGVDLRHLHPQGAPHLLLLQQLLGNAPLLADQPPRIVQRLDQRGLLEQELVAPLQQRRGLGDRLNPGLCIRSLCRQITVHRFADVLTQRHVQFVACEVFVPLPEPPQPGRYLRHFVTQSQLFLGLQVVQLCLEFLHFGLEGFVGGQLQHQAAVHRALIIGRHVQFGAQVAHSSNECLDLLGVGGPFLSDALLDLVFIGLQQRLTDIVPIKILVPGERLALGCRGLQTVVQGHQLCVQLRE